MELGTDPNLIVFREALASLYKLLNEDQKSAALEDLRSRIVAMGPELVEAEQKPQGSWRRVPDNSLEKARLKQERDFKDLQSACTEFIRVVM